MKGTTYAIGKMNEPHYLETVQRNDFEKKKFNSLAHPERFNQEA